MNPAAIAAIALALYLIWKIFLAFLSYRGNTSPEGRRLAAEYFDQDAINRGRRYTRVHIPPTIGSTVIGVIFLWFAVFEGLAAWFQGLAQGITSIFILQVGVFLVLFSLAQMLVSLPLDVYSDYVLKKRQQVLKIGFWHWLGRQGKQLAIGLVLSWFLYWVFLALARALPDAWWAVVGTIVALFMIFMIFVQPILLAPLFYKFTRLEDGELRTALLAICSKAGITVKDIFVQHESNISTSTNAYFTGLGGSKRIVLYDNLIENHQPDEIASVVAHEASHWKYRHIFIMLCISVLSIYAGSYVLAWLFSIESVQQFFNTRITELTILPVISLIAMIAQEFIGPFGSAFSRALERQADAGALALTDDPEAMVRMEVKLVTDNKIDILAHPFVARLRASHPPVLQRIRMAEENKTAKE